MDYSYTLQSSSTSVESRNVLFQRVDRITPKLPSPMEIALSEDDRMGLEAFCNEYTNPDSAFDSSLSSLSTRNNASSKFGPSSLNDPAYLPDPIPFPKTHIFDPFIHQIVSAELVIDLSSRHAASFAPSEPIFDLGAFPAIRKLSFAEPEHPGTERHQPRSHTPASFQVASLLYPDISPSKIGMDPVTPETHSLEYCCIANCGQQLDVSLSSICAHIKARHPTTPVHCQCGMVFKGGDAFEVAWHVHHKHFCAEYIVCRSCKVVRKPEDFAIHLRLCPALLKYRESLVDCARKIDGLTNGEDGTSPYKVNVL